MLHMVAANGTGIYVNITAAALRGVVPSSSTGVSLLYRNTDGTHGKSGPNQWGRTDLTAAELAAELQRYVSVQPWSQSDPGVTAPRAPDTPLPPTAVYGDSVSGPHGMVPTF